MEWLLGQELLLYTLALENSRVKHEASRRTDSDEPGSTMDSSPGRPEKMTIQDFSRAYREYWRFSLFDEESYSIEEFCKLHDISRRTYFKLKSKIK